MKTIFFGVMWVGRATVFLVGLVVVLGLTLAIVADAAEARVPALKKGVVNTVNAVTSMVGSVAGPVLRLDNNSTDASATGLDIQVESSKAPLTVNDTAGTATNLSADELDGQDSKAFLPSKIYTVEEEGTGTGGANANSGLVAQCDTGDVLVGGGFFNVDAGTVLRDSDGNRAGQQWTVNWTNNATADSVGVEAHCADFPPLRP